MQVILPFLAKQVISDLNFTGHSPAAILDLSALGTLKPAREKQDNKTNSNEAFTTPY